MRPSSFLRTGATWLALGLAALVVAGCPSDDDAPLDGDVVQDAGTDVPPTGNVRFTVATWNVENFFDTANDPDTFDDVPSRADFDRKLDDIARVLIALDADLVALQEVENEALLQTLVEGPAASLGYTEYRVIDGFDPRGIDVAFLARVPITNVASHLGESFPAPDGSRDYFWTRDALEVFAEPGRIPVTVMVLHLRSQRDGGDEHRLAEAMQARRIADRRLEAGVTRMIIAGDLNDRPGSDVLDAVLGDGSAFSDLSRFVPAADRYTFTFAGRQQQLDYILGTDNLESELLEARILHGPEIDAASDHAPVVATFELQRE